MLSLSFNDFLIELTPKPTSQSASESHQQITAVKAGNGTAGHGWSRLFKSPYVTAAPRFEVHARLESSERFA